MRIHVVQKGETVDSVAKKYGLSADELQNMNRQLSSVDQLLPKMKLKVPMEFEKHQTKNEDKVEEVTPERETQDDNAEINREVVDQSKNENEALSSDQKNFQLPHDPYQPRVLPRINEDEYVMSDKMISSIDEDQEDEFIQQFLPDHDHDYDSGYQEQPYEPFDYDYDYNYPVQTMTPVYYDYRHMYPDYAYPNAYSLMNAAYPNYSYSNDSYFNYPYPNNTYWNYSYPNYVYPGYNPCGCGGYYY
ncbi:LysM peptidoglycan-binding domain-containing protein [Tenuibacillus multivorans]|uniref:LysM domain-containing protein n=1 Tax=Tenuibacillus multivorans TaxID=237069 RepID=A0A1G9ZM50_9BACI|nr:LysM domain-containing protein [Tenuibacillus multivorans]GEL77465.1 hypothetical protein TMU01_17000 [Tenuibacillus multivorans]SDN21706.1 LysM domain-containing protein [Tenuibacillus multivorans]